MKFAGCKPTSNEHVWEGPDGVLVSERPPGAWLDTNVILEIYSFGDIIDAKRNRTGEDVETRRVRMQGTLWLATILSLAQAVTLSYSHEGLRNLARMCPPGSDLQAWSRTILSVLGQGGVFDGWIHAATDTGAGLSNRQRDRHMIEMCRKNRWVLFTRDRRATDEARAVGVQALTPEDYAVQFMPRSLAERYFMQRLDAAIRRYVARGPDAERTQRAVDMWPLRAVYEHLWRPVGPAEPFSAESMFRRSLVTPG